jgi:hypothetical protein
MRGDSIDSGKQLLPLSGRELSVERFSSSLEEKLEELQSVVERLPVDDANALFDMWDLWNSESMALPADGCYFFRSLPIAAS